MAIPQVPQILKRADWDKQKGIIAKIGVGETGIGAAMDKVKAAYDAVDWKKFDAKDVFATGSPNNTAPVDLALKAAMAEYRKVEKIRAELRALEGLALKAQTTFKSKPLIPKSSTEHAGKIAAEADKMAVALKSMDAEFKTFETMKNSIEAKIKLGRQKLIAYTGKMPGELSKLKSKPNVEAFGAFRSEHIRGLAAALSVNAELKEHMPKWKEFSVDSFLPKNDAEVKQKVALVERELNVLVAAMNK